MLYKYWSKIKFKCLKNRWISYLLLFGFKIKMFCISYNYSSPVISKKYISKRELSFLQVLTFWGTAQTASYLASYSRLSPRMPSICYPIHRVSAYQSPWMLPKQMKTNRPKRKPIHQPKTLAKMKIPIMPVTTATVPSSWPTQWASASRIWLRQRRTVRWSRQLPSDCSRRSLPSPEEEPWDVCRRLAVRMPIRIMPTLLLVRMRKIIRILVHCFQEGLILFPA